MMSTKSLLIVLLIIAAIGIVVWVRSRTKTFKRASNMAREIFPVWAGQGPFESGQQSAAAMRYAYLAVRGPEETEQMAEAFAKHAQIYDQNPATWEELRQDAEKQSDEKTEEHITVAKGLAAIESLDLDIIEERFREVLERDGNKQELASLIAVEHEIRARLGTKSDPDDE